MVDFTTIDYLKNGNEKQKKAFEVLTKYQIFEKLKEFSPVLAGTIPIEIDIEESDLDIICEVENIVEFQQKVKSVLPENIDIQIEKNIINETECIVLNCILDEFAIEFFGQNKKTAQQNAFLHMLAEYRILQEKGEDFKQKIIELKQKGIKTEPAFGILLGLENPYEDLLKF